MLKEIKNSHNLFHDLGWVTEVMGIILTESSDSGQSRKGSRELISMQDSEISISDWQVSPASLDIAKHEAMSWAVHWLHTESLSLNFC
jgi:hypothetical protein